MNILKENYFIASYDTTLASNKKAKNSDTVGEQYKTNAFKTLDKFLETSQLLKYNSCSFGGFFNNNIYWKSTTTDPRTIRRINLNIQGFQLLFIDVDGESYNDIYSPTYIDNNIQKIADSNCALILKSTSYGNTPKDKEGNVVIDTLKYPNGIKEGKRLLWILDKPITTESIQNYFSVEEWDNITSNLVKNDESDYISREKEETYEVCDLLENGEFKVNQKALRKFKETTAVLNQLYRYFVYYIGREIGIAGEHMETIGFDPASLKMAQK
ncbi:MAG: hypothetical protein EKK64_07575, partial [Neisseriaceae bacterium]